MRVLFIHQNFPGQYRHIARALHQRGDEVAAIGGPTATEIPGVKLHRYQPLNGASKIPECHPWASDFQVKCIRAEAVARSLECLAANGFKPDVVVGHPGWGELLAIKDLLPATPVLHQVEFVYQLNGGDVNFDPEFQAHDLSTKVRTRLKRSTQFLAFHDLDWGLAPTHWQAQTAPREFHNRISVIHEGINTKHIAPRSGSRISLKRSGLEFKPGDEVISYVARNLEPYRGFHVFMRMLPLLQKLRPKAHAIIVGGDDVSYGRYPDNGGPWRKALLRELQNDLDMNRIHFVGRVPHGTLHDLFRVTACHVYLTYPFVLSWSLLEAMSCGAVVIGSATPPVQEVITSGETGVLVDFFDTEHLATTIARVLADPQSYQHLGIAGRQTVIDRYDLASVCLPKQIKLIEKLGKRVASLTL